MTRKIHYLLAIVFVAFLATSCKKDNGNDYPNETKIDIKGSLMKPDQRTEDVTAGLDERTLYVRFFKDYDETEVSILSLNGEKLFGVTTIPQRKSEVQVYLGNQLAGTYNLRIENNEGFLEGEFEIDSLGTPRRWNKNLVK